MFTAWGVRGKRLRLELRVWGLAFCRRTYGSWCHFAQAPRFGLGGLNCCAGYGLGGENLARNLPKSARHAFGETWRSTKPLQLHATWPRSANRITGSGARTRAEGSVTTTL